MTTSTDPTEFDRLGDRIDTTCECDLDRSCNFPPCVMAADMEYRSWTGHWPWWEEPETAAVEAEIADEPVPDECPAGGEHQLVLHTFAGEGPHCAYFEPVYACEVCEAEFPPSELAEASL